MTRAPHTTILHTDEPVQIVVGERSDRWHRVLNALYAEGIMAGLKDREYRVLHVMMLLRQEDGHAYAPIESIQTLTGYSSSRNIEYALSALLGHPRGLLAAAGRDRYLVLPGWSFAGRDERTSVREPAQERTNVREPTHHRSRITHDRSWPEPGTKETHARSIRDSEFVVDDDLVAVLTETKPGRKGGPFSRGDAASLLAKPSATRETVLAAVRNADELGRAGKIEKSWRGYVVRQITNGCTLFAHLAASDDLGQRNTDAIRAAIDALEVPASPELDAVNAWWASLGPTGRAQALTAHDRTDPPEALWGRLCRKAGARSPTDTTHTAG